MTDKIVITMTDKRRMEEELAQLTAEKKRISEEIKTALGFGDLSENAEYHEAKENEGKLYGRINELEARLRAAEVIDDSEVSTEQAGLGTAVRVLDLEFDEEDTYTIVGLTEVDPDKLDTVQLFARFYEEQAGEPMDEEQRSFVQAAVRAVEGGADR